LCGEEDASRLLVYCISISIPHLDWPELQAEKRKNLHAPPPTTPSSSLLPYKLLPPPQYFLPLTFYSLNLHPEKCIPFLILLFTALFSSFATYSPFHPYTCFLTSLLTYFAYFALLSSSHLSKSPFFVFSPPSSVSFLNCLLSLPPCSFLLSLNTDGTIKQYTVIWCHLFEYKKKISSNKVA
jgi:hypothetical protein